MKSNKIDTIFIRNITQLHYNIIKPVMGVHFKYMFFLVNKKKKIRLTILIFGKAPSKHKLYSNYGCF